METSAENHVTAIRNDYIDSKITREEYWLQMREQHRALAEYCHLVAESEVRCIEIDSEGMEVVLTDGIRMRWDPEDIRSAPNVMINHGNYEPDEARILAALAASARTVLDIGANAGLMSLRMARAGATAIHAFEPVHTTYRELVDNVQRNGLADRIHCYEMALGDQRGAIEFHLPEIHGSAAASARAIFPDRNNKRVAVNMTTLDEIATAEGFEAIDLVKCDVEGAEILVLRGAMETLRKNTPVLMLELLKKWSKVYGYHPNDVLEMLKPLGYQAFSVEPGRLVEVPTIDESTYATNFFFFADHHRRERGIVEAICAQKPVP